MKKQTITKIIQKIIIFVFVISVFQMSIPLQAATESSMGSLYANPNQGNNAYKFKISDVVSSGLLTSVVGCTGVVNKVSTWMTRFIQSPKQQAKITKAKVNKMKEQMISACAYTKASTELGVGTVPWVNDLTSPIKTLFSKINMKVLGAKDVKACQDQVAATSDKEFEAVSEQLEQDAEKNLKEQCFDGIAITLARNQLTSMTRSAMNWVNSGYGGNPFFVQNMRNLTTNIERNVIETGIDVLLAPNGEQSPYARNFAQSTIYGQGIKSSSTRFLGGLQSDLEYFITDPKSYYSDKSLDKAQDTRTALIRAQDANNAFANDFSVGGWNAWLALTQREQNNPLGFNMMASQYLEDTQAQKIAETQNELTQNSGFLSQKSCLKWQMYDKDGKKKTKKGASLMQDGVAVSSTNQFVYSTSEPRYLEQDNEHEYGVCIDWKTVTPGSIIKDKTTNYLNSPERQLELAKTINDSLNALFSVLISKLEGGGLSGLSDSKVTTNWTDSINTDYTSADGNSTYDNGGAYDDFNLTRDLGNTYIHSTTYPRGKWNAKNNITVTDDTSTNGKQLLPTYTPDKYDASGNIVPANNSYYTVSVAGKTKLMNAGYNSWDVGDRAFWDGNEWQNWKKGQASAIKKRGVIQIQQDYIVAAGKMTDVLSGVMPKLGELDYCIPGPNQNYQINSTDAQSAYQDWVGSMYVGPRDANREEWRIDTENSRTFKILASIYADNQKMWGSIKNSASLWLLHHFGRDTGTTPVHDCINDTIAGALDGRDDCQNYHWHKDGKTLDDDQQRHVDDRTRLMELNLDYVNNNLFQNFYDVFDQMTDKIYFKNMTSKYLESENKSINQETDKNPGYVPMAESGLDLVKNIYYYNEDINKANKDYTDAIAQAKINIAKLNPIKEEVSGIIKAAQDRRDIALVEKLAKEGTTTTVDQFKKDYAACLAEENMSFYDADGITGMGDPDEERCFDGYDNDQDGLIDAKDPDCSGKVAAAGGSVDTGVKKCIPLYEHEVHSYISDTYCGDGKCLGTLKDSKYTDTPCENRAENGCSSTEYISAKLGIYKAGFLGFDPYAAFGTRACIWASATPQQGQCSIVPGSSKELHAYINSDFSCGDGKCFGKLKPEVYSPVSCVRRGPEDCSKTGSITSGPVKVKNGWFNSDPYNRYGIDTCEWTNPTTGTGGNNFGSSGNYGGTDNYGSSNNY